MILEKYSEEKFVKLSNSKLSSVSIGKIYFLTSGRNAWHSTWIHRYKSMCMHTQLKSARTTAELGRKQGSVFYIKELPALFIQSNAGFLAITQINTYIPLGDYSPRATRDNPGWGRQKIEGAQDCYIAQEATIRSTALSFDIYSRFWKNGPPAKNSVIVLGFEGFSLAFEPLTPKSPLFDFKSWSAGPSYQLQWGQEINPIGSELSKPINEIVDFFYNNANHIEK